jgi:predicted metal-dependent hydrolase
MSPRASAPDARLVRGVEEFNAGAFWEAHESWEELWNDSEGDAKRAVQALVQIAAGYHKLELGVTGGAMRLFTRALAILDDVPASAMPLPLDDARAVVRRQLAALRMPSGGVEVPTLVVAAPR